MGKGREYELDMVRWINDVVDPRWVHCATPDRSGNAADTFYDLEVSYSLGYDGHAMHMVELKKRSGEEGKRETVMSGGHDGESGLEELRRLIDGCTNWQDPWVVVKFDRREAVVTHAEDLHFALCGDTWRSYGEEAYGDSPVGPGPRWQDEEPEWSKVTGPRLTPSDNISMIKPTLSVWPSSSKGEDDHIKLLKSFPYWENNRFHDGDENARELNEQQQ